MENLSGHVRLDRPRWFYAQNLPTGQLGKGLPKPQGFKFQSDAARRARESDLNTEIGGMV